MTRPATGPGGVSRVAAVVAALAALASVHAQPSTDATRPRSGPATGPGVVSASTRHLDLVGTASADSVQPGGRLSIRFRVTPKPGFHVYAPGADYQWIRVHIEPDSRLRVHDPDYPPAEMLFFEPLKEWVPVYTSAFELVQELTVGATPRARAQLATSPTVTVRGGIRYQACDARVCYLPATVPFEWQVRLRTAGR